MNAFPDPERIEAIAVVNNAISARLTRAALVQDGIALDKVALVCARDMTIDWAGNCAWIVRYKGKPRHGILAQHRFAGFFVEGSRVIKLLLRAGGVKEIYIVNNDNLLTNHLIRWCERRHGRRPRVTVIAEGIMNYQHIDLRDRARWRWWLKPMLARLLGLMYKTPTGHLSGAFEPVVDRVISFAAKGLQAPRDKIHIIAYPEVRPKRAPEPSTGLIVHTGLWQWMGQDEYLRLAHAFAGWVRQQQFSKLLVKPHPQIATGVLDDLLPEFEVLQDRRSVEDLAAEISAATVAGTCCTALATLKLLRPDIRCVDFGADFYCEHAYHGDKGVIALLEGVGAEIVDSGLLTQVPN